jgi:2-polyprenyl-3-methyl-5-hydroxy-6-metoxy-1,4-benzoquinol methylase
MIPRVLESEAMDAPEEVVGYDAMDHSEVNARFVGDFLGAHGPCRGGEILDAGTGTARIPITLARADPGARILALDLSENMLALAAVNIASSGLAERIRCLRGDVKGLEPVLGQARFEGVISNTIIHHIPEPAVALAAMKDRVAPGGTLMVRDLARPASQGKVARLVLGYAGRETLEARALFKASLHAALTLEEIRQITRALALPSGCVAMTSDRHWTLTWQRPA